MNYKIVAIAATLALISSSAFAEGNRIRTSANSFSNSSSSAAARSNSSSRSASNSNSQGGNASQNNTNNSSFQDRKQAPGIGIPGLTSGAVTCLGSVSAGLSVAGFGGGLGSTYLERDCESRAAAELIDRLGYRRAAIQLLVNEHPMVNRAMVGVGAAHPIARRK